MRFAITGEQPGESELVLPPAAVHLGFALDLVLLVPANLIAAALLWRRHPWGYALATGLLTFGTVFQLNYVVALWFQDRAGVPGAVGWDPAEPFIIGILALAALAMWWSMLAPHRLRQRRQARPSDRRPIGIRTGSAPRSGQR